MWYKKYRRYRFFDDMGEVKNAAFLFHDRVWKHIMQCIILAKARSGEGGR